jgi:hypothetical protein
MKTIILAIAYLIFLMAPAALGIRFTGVLP